MGVSNKVASEWKHKAGVSNKVASVDIKTFSSRLVVSGETKRKDIRKTDLQQESASV